MLFVGQAPGHTETLTKIPFTGGAGKTHYSICRQAGLQKMNLSHTNICSCYPPEDRKPTPVEINNCFPRLQKEIHEQKPKLIIALGEVAMQALTHKTGISKQRGRFHPLIDKYNYKCTVLCLFHPSFITRQRQWIPASIKNYNLIHDFFNSTLTPDLEPTFILDPSLEELKDYLESYSYNTIIGVDTESTGLDTLNDTILGHSFSGDLNTALALKYLHNDPRWEYVQKWMEDPRRLKCWQNGSYDISIGRTWGINDQGFHFDTRLAQQLLHSDLPSDLDFLRTQYTNIPPYKPEKKKIGRIAQWGTQEMLEYAAWDAVTTKAVMQEQLKLLTPGQITLMQELLIPLVYAIDNMHRRGNLVDKDMLASLYIQCAPQMEEIEEKFTKLNLNPRSPKQVKEYLNLKTTNIAELKKQINRNHPESELMQNLLDYRGYHKLASVYLKGIYKRLDSKGRTHPKYKIDGTGTGRLSSQDPNMQNVPEEMRVIYHADPGYILLNADYSQIELWVGAVIADEDQMLKDLQDGLDIHNTSCQLCFPEVKVIYNDRKKDFTHRQQLIAKTINFGTLYGRTPYSIAVAFKVTVEEAQRWQMKLMDKYPGLKRYRDKCTEDFNTKGFLTTPFGRLRYITSKTQGFNFPIQSTASDVTLKAIVLSDQANLWCWATIHDSIVYHIKEDEFEEKLKIIKNIIERPVPELKGVSFNADYQKGYNWYNLQEI